MRACVCLVSAAAFLLGADARAATDVTSRPLSREQIVALFAKLEKLSKAVTVLKVKFKKITIDPMIEETDISEGVLMVLKPNCFYQSITTPPEQAVIIALVDKKLSVYYPSAKPRPRVEIYDLKAMEKKKKRKRKRKRGQADAAPGRSGQVAEIMEGLSFQLADMEKKFQIGVFEETVPPNLDKEAPPDGKSASGDSEPKASRKRYRIELVPRKDQKALLDRFSRLKIWTDGTKGWPLALQYVDPAEEGETTYEFGRPNQEIKLTPKSFKIKFKRRTKVIRYP